MNAKLIVEEGNSKGLILILNEGESWTIGSEEESQLILPSTSPIHLIAKKTANGITLENLNLDNAVFINNEELLTESLLNEGDFIQIGTELLRYQQEQEEEEKTEEAENLSLTTNNESDVEDDREFAQENPEETIKETIKESLQESVSNELDQNSLTQILESYAEATPSLTEESADPIHENPLNPEPEDLEFSPEAEKDSEISNENPINQENYDTIFGDDEEDIGPLAEINFDLAEMGRWLLKVIGGPNNGAEFYMQADHEYIIGTDPKTCDIIFHDTSVSRQHAKLSINHEETLSIEDLRSSNGVWIDGIAIKEATILNPNSIVTLGTTSFIIYDREGEMQTIISPLIPSLIKSTLQREEKIEEEGNQLAVVKDEQIDKKQTETIERPLPFAKEEPAKPEKNAIPLILIIILSGVFLVGGIAIVNLFKDQPVERVEQENTDDLIQKVLISFPSVKYFYNKVNHSLMLLGHVSKASDKAQLLYHLQSLKFIKPIDDSGIIIDEYVTQEFNSILSRNPIGKGISVHSPEAGKFIISGQLKTRKQSEELSSLISLNFPYLDLLTKQILVEDDVAADINNQLRSAGLPDVVVTITNGDVILTGTAPIEKLPQLDDVIDKIKQIPGLRNVNNYVKTQAPQEKIVNISDQYRVTGTSRIGNKITVVVNGRILSEGDNFDGMDIEKITSDSISLKKGDIKYRINY